MRKERRLQSLRSIREAPNPPPLSPLLFPPEVLSPPSPPPPRFFRRRSTAWKQQQLDSSVDSGAAAVTAALKNNIVLVSVHLCFFSVFSGRAPTAGKVGGAHTHACTAQPYCRSWQISCRLRQSAAKARNKTRSARPDRPTSPPPQRRKYLRLVPSSSSPPLPQALLLLQSSWPPTARGKKVPPLFPSHPAGRILVGVSRPGPALALASAFARARPQLSHVRQRRDTSTYKQASQKRKEERRPCTEEEA